MSSRKSEPKHRSCSAGFWRQFFKNIFLVSMLDSKKYSLSSSVFMTQKVDDQKVIEKSGSKSLRYHLRHPALMFALLVMLGATATSPGAAV